MKESIEEIAPALYRITIPLTFGLDCVHTYAIDGAEGVALFDCGPDMPESASMYNELLGRIGRTLKDVSVIFISHGHPDHCGFAGRIKEISGAKVFISQIEFEALVRAKSGWSRAESVRAAFRRHGAEEEVIKHFSEILDAFSSVTAPFTADRFLNDKESLSFGRRRISVMYTPGHARGHLCFLLEGDGILIAGDCILPDITPNLSPDYSCPSFLPLESFISSLRRLAALDIRRVYPAHGEPFDDLKERAAAIIAHHHERTLLTLEALGGNRQTAAQVSRKIFGEAIPVFDKGLAINETCVHLMQLEKAGAVKSMDDQGTVYFQKS